MKRDRHGFFTLLTSVAQPGDRYYFLVEDDTFPYPDPASQYQPDGPHGTLQNIVILTPFIGLIGPGSAWN